MKLAVAPFRAIFAIVGEIGSAISDALGIQGVNVAFEPEQGFQGFLGVLETISHVAIGVGKAIGQVIGGAIGFVVRATEGLRTAIIEGIGGLIMQIPRLLGRLYDMLPDFAKGLIDRVLGGGKQMIMGLIDAGSGVATPKIDTQAPAVNVIQQTNGALAKTKTKPPKKTELEKQQEAAAKLVQSLTRKNELDSLATDEARKLKELEFAKADIAARFPLLKQEEIEKLQQLLQENYDITEEKRKQKKLDEDAKKAADELADKYKKLGDAIKDNVTDAIIGAIEGTKSLGEAALDIVKQLGRQFLTLGINQAFGALGQTGGFLGKLFGGGKASGGTVQGGRSYMVGERGPELFTPGRTGSIAPSGSFGGANVTVNVDASGSSVQGDAEQASQLGKVIGIAVQQELIKQKRPGGLLAS